ncbi:hypothetical protein [Laspinema olomoucense]|uniref:hypothetical protein n=1 Tax=Laspinema olomoucense TaxID=3231600 RepID=UPI0021BA4A95|nr:hypothetical protein [Laspinema sp. D3d]MCT7975195.1 hypothetical protein [Laspinema sp. D3d]
MMCKNPIKTETGLEGEPMEKLVFVVIAVATASYVVVLNFLLTWLAQFPWYPFAFNSFLFSLGVVVVGGMILGWAEEKSDRHWATEIAQVLIRPCALYLGAIGSLLYAIALVVLAPFLLPFWVWNNY